MPHNHAREDNFVTHEGKTWSIGTIMVTWRIQRMLRAYPFEFGSADESEVPPDQLQTFQPTRLSPIKPDQDAGAYLLTRLFAYHNDRPGP
jgi:hypothetical protein